MYAYKTEVFFFWNEFYFKSPTNVLEVNNKQKSCIVIIGTRWALYWNSDLLINQRSTANYILHIYDLLFTIYAVSMNKIDNFLIEDNILTRRYTWC